MGTKFLKKILSQNEDVVGGDGIDESMGNKDFLDFFMKDDDEEEEELKNEVIAVSP